MASISASQQHDTNNQKQSFDHLQEALGRLFEGEKVILTLDVFGSTSALVGTAIRNLKTQIYDLRLLVRDPNEKSNLRIST